MNKLLGLMFSFLLLPLSVSAVQSDIDPLGSSKKVCTNLTYDLRIGSKDMLTNGQVSDLQLFLQTAGYLKSEPTGYFGLMTFDAVSKFQVANSINGTGFVGPLTRTKINSQSCGSSVVTENHLDVAPPYSYVQGAIYEEIETPSQDLNNTGNPILYRYKISAPKDKDITIVNENVFVLRVGVSFEPITLKVFSDKKFKNLIQKKTVSGTVVNYVTENLNFPFSPNIVIKAGDSVYLQVETTVGGTKDNAYITTSHKGLGGVTVSAGYVPQNQNYKPVITMVRAKAGGDFEAYAGEALSIEGKYLAGNFISTTNVYLGGVKATVNQANDNLLWITTPDLPDGTYSMTVSNEKGTSDTVSVRTHGNKTSAFAVIDFKSLTSSSPTPTLTGNAYNIKSTEPFGISISDKGGKVWGSGNITVNNNRWSTKINTPLAPGTYKVDVYYSNNLLTTGTLKIASTESITINATVFGGGSNELFGSYSDKHKKFTLRLSGGTYNSPVKWWTMNFSCPSNIKEIMAKVAGDVCDGEDYQVGEAGGAGDIEVPIFIYPLYTTEVTDPTVRIKALDANGKVMGKTDLVISSVYKG